MHYPRLRTIFVAAVAASCLAAPALARNPFMFNNYSYTGGMNYNPGVGAYPMNFFGPSTQGIDQHKNNLSVRINQAYAQGKISPSQAQRLTNDLNRVNTREMKYLQHHTGAISELERVKLTADLDGIGLTLDRYIAERKVFG